MDDVLRASIEAAVDANPADHALRLHLAQLLLSQGLAGEARQHAAVVLSQDPGHAEALEIITASAGPPPNATEATSTPVEGSESAAGSGGEYDWSQAESEVSGVVPPMFVDAPAEETDAPAFDVDPGTVRLADVGGMADVKKRIEAAFLAPMRNPELSRLYGKSLRGGLMLYGPPGCGKTFLAKAIAGELEAGFMSVSLADILDMFIGNSERNVHELFETARAAAPVVLFLDELDAIGQKRSLTRNTGMRTTVNQLLTELDGVQHTNDGVFVLAATNHPWDVDPALRRPGRLDRTLFVTPPDRAARETIFSYHLRDRPIERIDVKALAKRTEGYSGADIAHICDSGAELALLSSAESGDIRMIGMADLEAALADVRPSIGPWMETARSVALFANQSGEWDELGKFLRRQGLK